MKQHECKGQWLTIYQDPNLYNMGVHFLNPDTGFVVGVTWNPNIIPQGIILKTTDGGLTWDSTYTNFGNFMIEFPGTTTGYTGGHDGFVYKTTDMGVTWNQTPASPATDFGNGHFFSVDTGFVVTWPGSILKTNDGSNTWFFDTAVVDYSQFPGMGSIQFMNDTFGIIASCYNGVFARTYDRGQTWTSGSVDSNMYINAIYMKDETEGFAIGWFGSVSRTFDGGNTWTTPISLGFYHLHEMTFFNNSAGYIVGGKEWMTNDGQPNGIIYKTVDGGNTWSVVDSTFPGYLTSIQAVNDSVGYACGGNGLVLKIINGNVVNGLTSSIPECKFEIHPNPASENIRIITSEENLNCSMRLLSIEGKTLLHQKFVNSLNLDVSLLSDGIYFIELTLPNGFVESKKLVKTKH